MGQAGCGLVALGLAWTLSVHMVDVSRPVAMRLLTVEDVCSYLGVKKDFVYDQVKLGNLRCAKIARQFRFRQSDVDAFVEAHLT